MEDGDEWIDGHTGRVPPNDNDQPGRVASPESVMDRVERKLSSGAYDVHFERFSVERVSKYVR